METDGERRQGKDETPGDVETNGTYHPRCASTACQSHRRRIHPHRCTPIAYDGTSEGSFQSTAYVGMCDVRGYGFSSLDRRRGHRRACASSSCTDVATVGSGTRTSTAKNGIDASWRRSSLTAQLGTDPKKVRGWDGSTSWHVSLHVDCRGGGSTRVRRPPSHHSGFALRERIHHDDVKIEWDFYPSFWRSLSIGGRKRVPVVVRCRGVG